MFGGGMGRFRMRGGRGVALRAVRGCTDEMKLSLQLPGRAFARDQWRASLAPHRPGGRWIARCAGHDNALRAASREAQVAGSIERPAEAATDPERTS